MERNTCWRMVTRLMTSTYSSTSVIQLYAMCYVCSDFMYIYIWYNIIYKTINNKILLFLFFIFNPILTLQQYRYRRNLVWCNVTAYTYRVSYGKLYFNNMEKTAFGWVDYRMLRSILESPWDFEVSSFNCISIPVRYKNDKLCCTGIDVHETMTYLSLR